MTRKGNLSVQVMFEATGKPITGGDMRRNREHLRLLLMLLLAVPGIAAAQAQGDAAQNGDGGEVAEPVVVLEFNAPEVSLEGADAFAGVLVLADDPHLARMIVSPGPDGGVSGALVFPGVDAFTAWHDGDGSGFFDPLGESASIEQTLRVSREDLMRHLEDAGGLGSLDELSIEYANTDNDAAGDADIDAVTVICAGDDADCKPSN